MGWETNLFTNIRYNRKTYNSLYEVQDDIKECERLISYFKNQLQTLAACTEPKKIMDEDSDPLTWVSTTVDRILEDLEEAYEEKFKLRILEDSWDECHNKDGLAISPPKDIHWNTSYLDGDFINTDKNPKANEC